ncbi:MAG TPA: hypothetical protein DCE42_16180 [Myxococcales bacterium]|nr:hypothetical protein [Deltaproteobacteria bacterium]MBU48078.1 hypothetical protein [Deltaproteobacteria bacterium]HAA56303.1 hypothetical protein [Myxococcales bacterium]|tara:strand:+ start:2188 stop:2898 length:711 start_codon:yes stop_codon:yes gene_type:complete
MGRLISYLFSPKKLLEAIREHKIQIKGFFVLSLASVLTLLTVLPIFGILLAKIIVSGVLPWSALWKAFKTTAVLMMGIPLIKWLGQSYVIRFHLRSKQYVEQTPTFSVILLARSFGLLPIILLLPLKVLLLPPQDIVWHLFFPPVTSILLTGIEQVATLPAWSMLDFFVLTRAAPYVRPSFWISVVMFFLTFFLTFRKIRQLSELPSGFVFGRVLLAVISWDLCSFGVLMLLPTIL